jgi:SWIM/SEC-C metal-binding protein
MAKLGSEKNPLILRLTDDEKVDEIVTICDERSWHFILGIEPDEVEDLTDLERKLNPPILRATTKMGRNELCNCGSKMKFKKCCGFNA